MPGSSFFLSQVSAGLSSEAAWPEDLFHDRMSTAEIKASRPCKMSELMCGMSCRFAQWVGWRFNAKACLQTFRCVAGDLFHDRMSTAEINSIGPWKMVWCGMDLSVRTVGVLEIERKSVSPNLVS